MEEILEQRDGDFGGWRYAAVGAAALFDDAAGGEGGDGEGSTG